MKVHFMKEGQKGKKKIKSQAPNRIQTHDHLAVQPDRPDYFPLRFNNFKTRNQTSFGKTTFRQIDSISLFVTAQR